MATMPPDDDNPFAPPQALVGTRSETDFELDTEAELIRRHFLAHEALIKSLGLVFYLGAMFGFVIALSMILSGNGLVRGDEPLHGTAFERWRFIMEMCASICVIVIVIGATLGYGLRHLKFWARWTAMGFSALSVLFYLGFGFCLLTILDNPHPERLLRVLLVGIAIQGLIFSLLILPRSRVVFSADYRMVVARTPEIRCRTGLIVRIGFGLMAFLIFLILLCVISTVFFDL